MKQKFWVWTYLFPQMSCETKKKLKNFWAELIRICFIFCKVQSYPLFPLRLKGSYFLLAFWDEGSENLFWTTSGLCSRNIFLFVVIALHHAIMISTSCTHPVEEEALFLSSAEPQRGLLLLLSYFLHFGKQQEKEAQIFFWVDHFMVGFFQMQML